MVFGTAIKSKVPGFDSQFGQKMGSGPFLLFLVLSENLRNERPAVRLGHRLRLRLGVLRFLLALLGHRVDQGCLVRQMNNI